MAETSRETDDALVARLRAGDESAFASLVDDMHGRLIAVARTLTPTHALAEDVVQETWLGVIRGLRGFEGRSSIRTWILAILVRRARTMAAREARRAECSLASEDPEGAQPLEWEPGRGRIGLWEEAPVSWGLEDPDAVFGRGETLEVVESAVASLPPMQRAVVLLRDVEGMDASDVCNVLEISETNQRVLLHRGRARIRRALDQYIRGDRVRPVPPHADPTTATAVGSPPASVESARSRGKP